MTIANERRRPKMKETNHPGTGGAEGAVGA